MNYKQILALFLHQLKPLYPEREIVSILHLYLQEKLRMAKHHIFRSDFLFPGDLEIPLQQDLQRLAKAEPLQYVLEKTTFYDIQLKVNSDVLIPRPETEELVDWIIRENRNRLNLKILDICTGSGNIAIALAKHLPNAHITALDISEKALKIAKENAAYQNLTIHFLLHDIFEPFPENEMLAFDIIVSNPPYIPENKSANIQRNVMEYEPHLAFFVPDNDPLIFYHRIGEIAKIYGKEYCDLYFETYEQFHSELSDLFQNLGFRKVQSAKDINGRDRMMKIQKV